MSSSPPRLNRPLLLAAAGSSSAPFSPVPGGQFATAALAMAQGLNLGTEDPLLATANPTNQADLDAEALLANELAKLSADDFNPNWYLDPSYWQGECLPEAMPIPAMPFPINYPDRDNHLDFLKARLLVWNVMHNKPMGANANGDWAYSLVGKEGEQLTGQDLRNEYNSLRADLKNTLDQSCEVVFPRDVENYHLRKNLPLNHPNYAAHMGFATFVMAKLLRTGQVQTFCALWYLAREFRLCSPGFKSRNYLTAGGPVPAFKFSRSVSTDLVKLLPIIDVEGVKLETALNNQYAEFSKQFMLTSGVGLNVVVPVKGRQVQLSRCELQKLEVSTTFLPIIKHTPVGSLPDVLNALEFYFQKIQENYASDPSQNNNLFSLFWWAAHGCLDVAGSASKSDLCLRALYLAKFNKPLPAWKHGFVPDIEAMLCKHTGAFQKKIKTEAFAGGANWQEATKPLPHVF